MEAPADYRHLLREYGAGAARYDERWKSYTRRSIGETLRRCEIRPGDRVLDVGCGTGALLEEIARSVPGVRLAGLDLSAPMLGIAARKLGPAAELKLGRAEELPFEDASFDLVVSTSVLHFVRRPLEFVREARRVLDGSGRVVVTDWCRDSLPIRILDRLLGWFAPAHHRAYGTEELRRMLEQADFAAVEIERYRISWLWGLMTATADKGPRP